MIVSHLITWVLSVLIAIDVVIFLIALGWTLADRVNERGEKRTRRRNHERL